MSALRSCLQSPGVSTSAVAVFVSGPLSGRDIHGSTVRGSRRTLQYGALCGSVCVICLCSVFRRLRCTRRSSFSAVIRRSLRRDSGLVECFRTELCISVAVAFLFRVDSVLRRCSRFSAVCVVLHAFSDAFASACIISRSFEHARSAPSTSTSSCHFWCRGRRGGCVIGCMSSLDMRLLRTGLPYH